MKRIVIGMLAFINCNIFASTEEVVVDCSTTTGGKGLKVIYVERCPEVKQKTIVKWKTKVIKEPAEKCPAPREYIRTVTESKPYYRPHRVSFLIGAPSRVFTDENIVWKPNDYKYPVVGAMYQYSFNDRFSTGVSLTSDQFVTGIASWSFGNSRK